MMDTIPSNTMKMLSGMCPFFELMSDPTILRLLDFFHCHPLCSYRGYSIADYFTMPFNTTHNALLRLLDMGFIVDTGSGYRLNRMDKRNILLYDLITEHNKRCDDAK